MALNWVTIVDAKPLLLQGESSIEAVDNVKCNFTFPAALSCAELKKLEGVGTMTLTDQRIIWTNCDVTSSFKSLTTPLPSILSSKFEQPVFGANYLAIAMKPTPGGGLTDGATLEIRFINTGMFRFVSMLEKTRERAIFMKRQLAENWEHLPEYASSPNTSSASGHVSYAEPPPDYDG